jgi:LOR/SDH bifunctional enzyme conserved region/Saccharopine dehydrogenase NADP binding domain
MKRAESFLTVDLIGHLFDTGMISKVLDAIEDSSTSAHIVDFKLGKDRDTPTELRLQLFNPGHNHTKASKPGSSTPGTITPSASGTNLAALVASPTASTASGVTPRRASLTENSFAKTLTTIQEIAAATGVQVKIEGEESYIHEAVNAAKVVERSVMTPAKRILVLGAGFVSAPLVEYLHRRSGNHITLASMIKEEAVALAHGRTRVEPIQLDVGKVSLIYIVLCRVLYGVISISISSLASRWQAVAEQQGCLPLLNERLKVAPTANASYTIRSNFGLVKRSLDWVLEGSFVSLLTSHDAR